MNVKKENKKRSLGSWMLVLLAGVVLVLGGVSCSQDEKSSEKVAVTFAYQDRVADAASIIAVKKGFFAAEGLDVRPMIFSSGPACTEALTYGNAYFGTMGDTYPIFILVNSKFAASHPDVVAKMIKGLSRATAFIKDHPEEAVAIQAAQSGLAPEVIRKAMVYHHYGLSLDDSVLDSLAVTAQFLKDIGKIGHVPVWNEAVDPLYLQQLKGE